jgi:hypothetical protein
VDGAGDKMCYVDRWVHTLSIIFSLVSIARFFLPSDLDTYPLTSSSSPSLSTSLSTPRTRRHLAHRWDVSGSHWPSIVREHPVFGQVEDGTIVR